MFLQNLHNVCSHQVYINAKFWGNLTNILQHVNGWPTKPIHLHSKDQSNDKIDQEWIHADLDGPQEYETKKQIQNASTLIR